MHGRMDRRKRWVAICGGEVWGELRHGRMNGWMDGWVLGWIDCWLMTCKVGGRGREVGKGRSTSGDVNIWF